MLHARIARFDVIATVALFENLGWELNTRSSSGTCCLSSSLSKLSIAAKLAVIKTRTQAGLLRSVDSVVRTATPTQQAGQHQSGVLAVGKSKTAATCT